jgi:hypothetical protein
MSYAVTQKHHHIHVPWTAVITVGVAIAVAAAVLILVNQQSTQTATVPMEITPVAVSVEAAAVATPESPALRRQLAEEVATQVPQELQFAYPRNHVPGVTLAPLGTMVGAGQLAIQVAPNDPHPLNHFPSEP